jgi:hypothetical protein
MDEQEFDRGKAFQDQVEEQVKEAKKKRGRPRKPLPPPVQPGDEPKSEGKRPACEDITAKYPMKHLIFYEEEKKHKGIGIFHDPEKGNMVAIMSFLVKDSGNLKWAYRVVPNKYGGKPIIHHDMTLVSPSNLIPLANALIKVAGDWFGTQREMDEKRIEYQEEVKKDDIGDKIKKFGLFS